ncbi:MAG: RNA polymerase sigma factor, partial [Ktedonobacteraceae bacterium]|nr:RNA polymerase sigma factor [Ktedonobacteraceae bacterium]
AWGVPPDAAEDVAQETFLEAWRHLEHLREPDRLEAWVSGICRNVCRRWVKAQMTADLRQVSLSPLLSDEHEDTGDAFWEERFDQHMLDPMEELGRQDLAQVLSRALGHLPPTARTALELYYLADLSQREAAQRLGVSLKALEVRLHRARRQLRQVLSRELRPDAEAFGLVVDEQASSDWHQTRIWCLFCARHHLQGRFERFPNDEVMLHMRCPGCLSKSGGEWISAGPHSELQGLQSFRPALRRLIKRMPSWSSVSYRQVCWRCGAPVETQLAGADDLQFIPPLTRWQGLRWLQHCHACGMLSMAPAGSPAWAHPLAQHFMAQHPRWLHEPEQLMDYAGQPALRVRLLDITSAAQRTFFVHAQTGQVLVAL